MNGPIPVTEAAERAVGVLGGPESHLQSPSQEFVQEAVEDRITRVSVRGWLSGLGPKPCELNHRLWTQFLCFILNFRSRRYRSSAKATICMNYLKWGSPRRKDFTPAYRAQSGHFAPVSLGCGNHHNREWSKTHEEIHLMQTEKSGSRRPETRRRRGRGRREGERGGDRLKRCITGNPLSPHLANELWTQPVD